MPAISDPEAVRFCNTTIRPAADAMCRAYYRASAVRGRWLAQQGTDADRIAVLGPEIRAAADAVLAAYTLAFGRSKLWFVIGAGALVPNTADVVADGAPADGRPAITGADATRTVDRMVDFENWLRTGTFDGSGTANYAALNTVLAVTSAGKAAMSAADATNFVVTRGGEIKAEYEANSGQKLGWLLAVAVNPGA